MPQELSQPPKPLAGGLKEINPQYPPPGTIIKIEKGDVFAGAGERPVSEKQAVVLTGPVDPADVRILPDTASLYLPWSWYAHRLTQCFGPMGWSLLPVTDSENNPRAPVAKDDVIYREYILRAEGRFVASAVGECAYRASNRRMTFGDAAEGARSNALSRCCKGLGMASEIYSEGWREEWTRANAVAVWCVGFKGREQLWRRARATPLKGEQSHAHPPCPCAACAGGAPNTARDGKPLIQPPQMIDVPATAKRKGKAVKPEKEAPEKKEDAIQAQGGAREEKGFREAVLVVEDVVVKKGTGKNGKPYTRFGVKGDDGNYYNTFSETLADLARSAKTQGESIYIKAKIGDYNGKPTYDLVELSIAEESPLDDKEEAGG